jgi:hypothetical protein
LTTAFTLLENTVVLVRLFPSRFIRIRIFGCQ